MDRLENPLQGKIQVSFRKTDNVVTLEQLKEFQKNGFLPHAIAQQKEVENAIKTINGAQDTYTRYVEILRNQLGEKDPTYQKYNGKLNSLTPVPSAPFTEEVPEKNDVVKAVV